MGGVMPGYAQIGNSCAAYTLLLTLHESHNIRNWSHVQARALWLEMQFTQAENPDFAANGYSNPCKMVNVAIKRNVRARLAISQGTRAAVATPGNPASALAPMLGMLDALAAGYAMGMAPVDPIAAAFNQNCYASIVCQVVGTAGLHNILVKRNGAGMVVYDSNNDDLTWIHMPNGVVPGNVIATGVAYQLAYTGFGVILVPR